MKSRQTFFVWMMLWCTCSVFAAEPVVQPYTGPGAEIPLTVVRQNMLDDPNFLARVAQAEGMTPARFIGQGEGRILQQARKYLAERAKQQAASGPASPAK